MRDYIDYIDRQAAMDAFAERVKRSNSSDFVSAPTWNDAVEIVENLPSVQSEYTARMMVFGEVTKWLGCSNCGYQADEQDFYCRHCGARFEG